MGLGRIRKYLPSGHSQSPCPSWFPLPRKTRTAPESQRGDIRATPHGGAGCVKHTCGGDLSLDTQHLGVTSSLPDSQEPSVAQPSPR